MPDEYVLDDFQRQYLIGGGLGGIVGGWVGYNFFNFGDKIIQNQGTLENIIFNVAPLLPFAIGGVVFGTVIAAVLYEPVKYVSAAIGEYFSRNLGLGK
ncbi:MAG: hypothetical protein HYT16_03355 [DPANN group archaeon]|nr:hypothetical protein [DPANN group archaeon]